MEEEVEIVANVRVWYDGLASVEKVKDDKRDDGEAAHYTLRANQEPALKILIN